MSVSNKKAAQGSVRKAVALVKAAAPAKPRVPGKAAVPAKAAAAAKGTSAAPRKEATGARSVGKQPAGRGASAKAALSVPAKATHAQASPAKAASQKGAPSTPAQTASAKTRADQLGIRAAALAHPFPPHDLGVAVPYLLARAGERMGNTFSKEIRPFKLTMNEWRVSVALHLQAHQRLSEIAAHTSADLSTISRVIDGLIRRGLAQRDRDSEDARAVAISLTEEGRLLTEKIIPIAQLYERVALSGISEEDAEKLRTLLRKVYDNIGILNGAS